MTTTRADRVVTTLGAAQLPELERLIAADPLVNAVVASRVAAYRSVDPARLGGTTLGTFCAGGMSAAAFNGGNLLPIGGDASDWDALASYLASTRRVCTSIVGRAEAVSALWSVLSAVWAPARAIRAAQPLLAVSRTDDRTVRADPRLRVMQPSDVERYLPAAAAMFTEELGISPFVGSSGAGYRRRIESLLAAGRSFGIVDRDGRMVFKADIGALTSQTCQLQGVWVRPDLRGQGIGTAALAGVLGHALRLAPSVSLYVNDFNAAARRVYAKLGMRQVGTLATVLF